MGKIVSSLTEGKHVALMIENKIQEFQVVVRGQVRHLMEHPMLAVCSLGPWPVSAI